jgi:hypothetical protein
MMRRIAQRVGTIIMNRFWSTAMNLFSPPTSKISFAAGG